MNDIIVDSLKLIAPLSVASTVFAQGLGIAPRLVFDDRHCDHRPVRARTSRGYAG
jgi:hypothetical protein